MVVKDVEAALEQGTPAHVAWRLLERRGRALKTRGEFEAAVQDVEDAMDALSNSKLAEEKRAAKKGELQRLVKEIRSCKEAAKKRGAREKDRALIADNHRLIRHGGHIGPSGRARAHDASDLRNAQRAHIGLIEEDAAKVIAVGEDFILQRQECTSRIDQIDTGEVIFFSNLLGPQVLFDSQRVIAASFDGRIVSDDDRNPIFDDPQSGDDTGCWQWGVVNFMGTECPNLKEWGFWIDQLLDAVADKQFSSGCMSFHRGR